MIVIKSGEIEVSSKCYIDSFSSYVKIYVSHKDDVPQFLTFILSVLVVNGVNIGHVNTTSANNVLNVVHYLLEKSKSKDIKTRHRYVRFVLNTLKRYAPDFC